MPASVSTVVVSMTESPASTTDAALVSSGALALATICATLSVTS